MQFNQLEKQYDVLKLIEAVVETEDEALGFLTLRVVAQLGHIALHKLIAEVGAEPPAYKPSN
jgi:hypothetical protein